MKPVRFDQLTIQKGKKEPVHRVIFDFGDGARSTFEFCSQDSAKAASAPFSEVRKTPEDAMVKTPRPQNNVEPRQHGFEAVVRVMAGLASDGLVPIVFQDRLGKQWKMDRDCVAWFANSDRADLVQVKEGTYAIRPR